MSWYIESNGMFWNFLITKILMQGKNQKFDLSDKEKNEMKDTKLLVEVS